MNMKVSQAVAAALALGATYGAQALDLSTVATGSILYIGGSTAIDNGITQRFINTTDGLCGTSVDTYANSNAPKFTAVACNAGANATNFGIALNTPIAYLKEDTGGSANGINPVNNNTTLGFPNPSTVSFANCPVGTSAANAHVCGAGVTALAAVPNFGYSDVNAELFGASTANLSGSASLDTLFGVATSLGFYHALQTVQGLTNDDTVGNMPSLTKGQVYSILQGGFTPNLIVSSNGALNTQTTTELFGTNTVAASACGAATTACATKQAATTAIYICERGQSSGTMQTSQVYFGDIGCASGVTPFAGPTTATCAASGCGWSSSNFGTNAVFAGNGTGDVLSCLQYHDSVGDFAIGIVGVENGWGVYQSNSARKDWRFTKLNNVAPSFENVAADRYQYWAQSASYAPKAGRPNVATGVAGGLASAAVQIGSAATVAALNKTFNYTAPAFDGGFLAIPGVGTNTPNASSVTNAVFVTNPVNAYNRGIPTATNNCQQPSLDLSAPDTSDYPTWSGP